MSKIKFLEKISGYPLVIPERGCTAADLELTLRSMSIRDDISSTSVQLTDHFHTLEFHNTLDALGFIVDEQEWKFSCDLTTWRDSTRVFCPNRYKFQSYAQTGISPYVHVAQSVSAIEHLKSKESISILKNDNFNPLLWETIFENGTPLAMYLAHIDDDGIGRLDYLAVSDSHQQKGIGTLMHIRAVRSLKSHGAKKYEGTIDVNHTGMISILNKTNCTINGSSTLYIK